MQMKYEYYLNHILHLMSLLCNFYLFKVTSFSVFHDMIDCNTTAYVLEQNITNNGKNFRNNINSINVKQSVSVHQFLVQQYR